MATPADSEYAASTGSNCRDSFVNNPSPRPLTSKVLALAMCFCLIIVATLDVSAQNPVECPAREDGANGSQLCLRLKFTAGKLDFDQMESKFSPSQTFLHRLGVSQAEAEAIVFAQIRKLFDQLPKAYLHALSDEQKTLDSRGQFTNETAAVRDLSGSFLEFAEAFNAWAEAGGFRTFFDIFAATETSTPTAYIFPLVMAHESTASIIYIDQGYDPDEALIRFNVADPIDNWSDPSQIVFSFPDMAPERTAKRLERIAKKLRSLSGRPRCRDCIRSRIVAYLRSLGLEPQVDIDDTNTSPLRITIVESPRIVSVAWDSTADKEIDKLLYSLLTDRAFRAFIRNRKAVIALRQFDYRSHAGLAPPYLDSSRLQIQQLLVTQLGYVVSILPADGVMNFKLKLQKLDSEEPDDDANSKTPDSAPATANREGVVTAHQQERDVHTDSTAEPKPTDDNKKMTDKKRYVGGGLEYRPRQGVRFFGLTQISRFPFLPGATNAASIKIGLDDGTNVLGAINYAADYVLFDQLHRRLSFQLTASSDFESDRSLNSSDVDERHQTGLARIEFEPFRDKGGSLLRFFAEGKRETIEFVRADQPTLRQNLTTLDLGALYMIDRIGVEGPWRLKLEPQVKIGLGLARDEPVFSKWLFAGSYHKLLSRDLEVDLRARFESASAETPLFELPSFGGSELLRGFRRDEGIGRRFWSLQNEIWIPIKVGTSESIGITKMIREKVRLSPFVDIGALGKVVEGASGTRVGTGVGLRFIYTPIVFKLDYAYGFQSTAGRGKFYFGIVSNLPF